MNRQIALWTGLVLAFASSVMADDGRRGGRIRFGRVEFGIPFTDSFITVHGDRTTVKVFSRGDITNVHTESGTQVDVGIRSLLIGREPMRGPGADGSPDGNSDAPPAPGGAPPAELGAPNSSAPPANLGSPQSDAPPANLGSPQSDAPPAPQLGNPDSNAAPPEPKSSEPPQLIPQRTPKPEPTDAPPAAQKDPQPNDAPPADASKNDAPPAQAAESVPSLDEADQANIRGDYRKAEAIATEVLRHDDKNQAAYSTRAASRIGRGELERSPDLVRQGLADIKQAIKLGKESGAENKRDYLVWLVGMNQLAALDGDRRRAVENARVVDEFIAEHVDKFPNDLKEKAYHQQGFARLLMGRQSEAQESFRNAARFGTRTERPQQAPKK